jgi:hypothetical protein
LASFITSLSSHLTRKRPADIFLHFVTYSSSIIIVFLTELSIAFHDAESNLSSPEEAVQKYLAQFPESSLANVLDIDQQRKKLKMVAEDILSNFLDPKAYECKAVRVFIREILAGVILESTITRCSRPEFINDWIVYLLQEGEPEIMNAIDAGVESARKGQTVTVGLPSADDGPLTQRSLHTELQFLSSQNGRPSKHLNQNTEAAIGGTGRLSQIIATGDTLNDGLLHDNSAPNGDPASFIATKDTMTSDSRESGQTKEFQSSNAEATRVHNLRRISLGCDEFVHQPASVANPDQSQSSPVSGALPSNMSTMMPESGLLTLTGASVLIDDGAEPGDKGIIRSRPFDDFSVQIEPLSSRHPGWMIFRKYSDFEQLHEALGPISRLNNIHPFTDTYPALPTWRGKTRREFVQYLQRYLRDALRHEPLAESERMKRFLDKDRGLDLEPTGRLGFSFPRQSTFENVGKGVLDVLTSAPKGVAEGGKAVFEGVTGVFGNVGVSKKASDLATGRNRASDLSSVASSRNPYHQAPGTLQDSPPSSHSRKGANESVPLSGRWSGERNHQDQLRSSHPVPSSDRAEALAPVNQVANEAVMSSTNDVMGPAEGSALPDHPLENIPERRPSRLSVPSGGAGNSEIPRSDGQEDVGSRSKIPPVPSCEGELSDSESTAPSDSSPPISEEETQVAVELIFAVINELYSLSSAWNIRRTLLNAAKSFLLRPGNPNLEGIRGLIQDSMIDANTSPEAVAMLISKLRENALPTEDEIHAYPPPLRDTEKEKLRVEARKLLVQRGVPRALMSVMGAAATREALGKVFDCLQVEVIARGFMFALLLQGIRAVIL